MDSQAPLPTSLAEVESLILALYDPATPHGDIASIQETLQRLQRSPEGWRLAQTLVDRTVTSTADDQVKFFGALTLIVKLNTESYALADDDATELLAKLLGWLAAAAGSEQGVLSTQKLVQALVTFFVQFPRLWPTTIKSLLYSLRAGRGVTGEDACAAPSVGQLVDGLDWRVLRVALLFVSNLVTDVGKTDMRQPKYAATHARLLECAPDVADLMYRGLATHAEAVQRETLRGLQAWILYAQRLPMHSADAVTAPLRVLVRPVVACLEDERLYDAAVELLNDCLSNYSKFFTEEHYALLASVFESAWGATHMQALLGGDFEYEPYQYALLLLAYGDARVDTLMTTRPEADGGQTQRLLALLAGLLTAQGHPVAEDIVFVPALEFWATFAETMLDDMYDMYADPDEGEGTRPAWVADATALLEQVVGHCWRKIQYPEAADFASWDSSDRAGFGDARKDVGDLLQTIFSITRRTLLTQFVALLEQSLAARAWAQIEATVYCVAALSDCVAEQGQLDDLLDRVFASALFAMLSDGASALPVRLRQTALTLIDRYAVYFERKPAQLPAALNLLFGAVGTPALALQASRAIATLCSSCRALLTGEVGAFVHQYRLLHDDAQLEPLAEERVVQAIAAVVQATPDETVRLQLAEQLLGFVVRDVEQCLACVESQSQSEPQDMGAPLFRKALRYCQQLAQQQAEQGGLKAQAPAEPSAADVLQQAVLIPLRCLAGMARGLQSTADGPVVVDLVESDDETPRVRRAPNPQLRALQSTVMAMVVAVQDAFPRSSEVADVVCTVVRAGFSETEPGPLVFPADMVTAMLVRQGNDNEIRPYTGVLVKTAQSFVSSLARGHDPDATAATEATASLAALVPWILGLLQRLPEPGADTELTQRAIEFVDCVLQKYAGSLLRAEPASQLEFFFMFTLDVLNGSEPLPKAAAAEFWATFVSLRTDDTALQALVAGVMDHLGPLLAQALVRNIGGHASRSELDKLADPLKKLVVHSARAQGWLADALQGPAFPSDRVSAADRTVFLKKLCHLRGARQTHTVVRDFWLACRGTQFAYAS